MKQAQPFNPLRVPIKGTNLIEASAGTGKTWSIAALFLRLIVCEKLTVEQILVVTYTRAATAELKTRLRNRLSEALNYIQATNPPEDAFLVALFKQASYPKKEQILRLQAALNHFDKAAIYTIHGFCQRVLQEYAFHSGSPFDIELVHEEEQTLHMLNGDFWREHIAHHCLWAKLVFKNNITPEQLLNGIKPNLNKPYLMLQIPKSTLSEAQDNLDSFWQSFQESQLQHIEHIFWAIKEDCLNGIKYNKNSYTKLFECLHLAIADKNASILLTYLPLLDKLIVKNLQANCKKGKELPLEKLTDFTIFEHLCTYLAHLEQAEQNELSILKFKLYRFLNQKLVEFNQAHKQRRFDDLLLELYQALSLPQNHFLPKTLAQKWPIALIDEFQDTDPIQYAIFSKIFVQAAQALFLVGDPKQAIYKFRGADIFAYLQASQEADNHYTLDINYRTHQNLLTQISALFAQHSAPFVLPQIQYTQIAANRHQSDLTPIQSGLSIQWLHSEPENQLLTKEAARTQAAQNCANRIAIQLNLANENKLLYQNQPLQAHNIAVLVSTHNQGKLISQELKKRQIDSVSLSQDSVFNTQEAQAILVLLKSWLNPKNLSTIRLLLSSLLFQYNAEQIFTFNHDDEKTSFFIEKMFLYQELWQNKGILAAYQNFCETFNITGHLLSQRNERSLTNLSQITELIAQEEKHQFTLHAQTQWLNNQILSAQKGSKTEATQLRLENDEHLVKIITIHSAKGLQYPIVYCPFIWDSKNHFVQELVNLHQDGQNHLISKEQLTEETLNLLEKEELSEQLRLLYVALTRAQEQLIITLGAVNKVEQTAIAYLMNAPTAFELTDKTIQFARQHQVTLLKEPVAQTIFSPTTQADIVYQARHFTGIIKQGPKLSSFSTLSTFTKSDVFADQPLPEPIELLTKLDTAEPDEPLLNQTPFNLSKGAQTGLCLHAILEQYDFTNSINHEKLIRQTLQEYHLDSNWYEVVSTIIQNTVTAQLSPSFSLAQSRATTRLAEMGFTFTINQFTPEKLKKIIKQPEFNLPKNIIQAANLLSFNELNGFCHGFIDLITQDDQGNIYIIDYKSNYLGGTYQCYHSSVLNEAMAEHHYYLQALLYVIATYRYLKKRNISPPNIYIRFLFLRGLHTQSNDGIWSWDFNQKQLDLIEYMIGQHNYDLFTV
ncbi:exodeoxyribonuclease V subunit beta [Neisseria sp. Ec49-e6-T10]|uniref:exodeoxyribonuclease V subunit beta n=1 Tax=Neisseria sp. Ec49-e6-T10 TaxID=3140744 RepID=UPI003EB72F6F